MNYEMQLLINRAILDRKYIEKILKSIHIDEPSLCIDVGCGPGISTKFISDCFLKAKVIGIDNSKNAIGIAKMYNCSNDISFIHANAESMPFENDSIDFCFSRMLLDIVPDIDTIIDEMIRVIKPTGYIVIYGNTRTTATGNIQPRNAEKMMNAYKRYVRLTKRIGYNVPYVMKKLNNSGLICREEKIIKDTNDPGRRALSEYYCVEKDKLDWLARNNILVKLNLVDYTDVIEYESDLAELLGNENVFLSFEQSAIIASKIQNLVL